VAESEAEVPIIEGERETAVRNAAHVSSMGYSDGSRAFVNCKGNVMKHPIMPVLIVGLLAVVAVAQTGSTTNTGLPPVERPPRPVIGVVPQEIADSSPVISATITAPSCAPANTFNIGSDINIHIVLQNRTDHDVRYLEASLRGIHGLVNYDVRDNNGDLPPETELGCGRHFFSPCHTETGTRALVPPPIAPKGTLEKDWHLNAEYELAPGTYTVVGYVCGMQEGPECFKTNTIIITVE
jgi:hypothetical protein